MKIEKMLGGLVSLALRRRWPYRGPSKTATAPQTASKEMECTAAD